MRHFQLVHKRHRFDQLLGKLLNQRQRKRFVVVLLHEIKQRQPVHVKHQTRVPFVLERLFQSDAMKLVAFVSSPNLFQNVHFNFRRRFVLWHVPDHFRRAVLLLHSIVTPQNLPERSLA